MIGVRGFGVGKAIRFKNGGPVYFCIGRTTAWDNELAPPAGVITTTEVSEIIGYKLCTVNYVIPDENGDIVIIGAPNDVNKWSKLQTDESAIANTCRWLLIESSIEGDELPVDIAFRQSGIYSRLVKAEGIPEGQEALLPAEVADNGLLEFLENHTPVYRRANAIDTLSVIIEF